MRKRNLATALAVLTIAGAVVPMTANAATAEPFNIANSYELSHDVWVAWDSNFNTAYDWAKSVDISRNENESEYDYYLRLRNHVATNWIITTEVPATVTRATEMTNEHKVDNAGFYYALENILTSKSDLMYTFSYYKWGDPAWSSEKYHVGVDVPTRYTEMENEYGQKQNIPSVFIHNCVEEHKWWEKDTFGVIRLDGKLYAMKMTTDSATCGTLIPYEELGYKNCDLHWGWNTNLLTARGYQMGASIPLDKNWKNVVYTSVYDADGSYNPLTMYKEAKQALVDGVLLYYCENGKITPMTEALHNTLPKNDTYYYATVINPRGGAMPLPAGWKLFAE